MFKNQNLMEKWGPVLDASEAPQFADQHRKNVTAALLENTEKALAEERGHQSFSLTEAAPVNATGSSIDNWDPILISLVRRAMPNLIAYDIAGVQPMSGPTGLIFAMKSNYTSQTGTEALHSEADTSFSGIGSGDLNTGSSDPFASDLATGVDAADTDTVHEYAPGTGMSTAASEALGDSGSNSFAEMAFSIEKATVTAKSRALKAEYTMELAQDLKAVHGLDAESELANILSAEILAEINREVVRTVNLKAKLGAQQADLTTGGTFDLDTDADGRWSAEKYKGLLVQIMREANAIAKDTRRGKGNFMIVSSDVAAALSATGMLDYTPALSGNAGLNIDDTGTTFAGTLSGGIKVYIDPYATVNYVNIGYKGTSAYDAGLFYCPYVPLTMVRAVGENTFQPKIGFKTRYGMVANPFVGATASNDTGANRANSYYRIFKVSNILGSA
tara:strand:+ start:11618 stop:12955 length:1338 start_codon:yes stop_codon:yes gene_type:complete